MAAAAEKACSSGRQEVPAASQVSDRTPDHHQVQLVPITGSQPRISEQLSADYCFADFQDETPDRVVEVAKLNRICAEGVKYLAELCGLCAERLQAMGSSLTSHVEHKQAATDISWPASPLEKAKYLHMQVGPNIDLLSVEHAIMESSLHCYMVQAMIMLASLEGLAEAFQHSLKQVAQAVTAQAPAKETLLQELTASLIRNLELSCTAAAMRLQARPLRALTCCLSRSILTVVLLDSTHEKVSAQDCVKGLIYVVALTSEEVQTALGPPEQV